MDSPLAVVKRNCLLQENRPFYALNLNKTMHWLPVTAGVSVHPSLYDHPVSMCLPNQPLPQAQSDHTLVIQSVIWLHKLFFTSLLVEPFPDCFLVSKSEQK